MITAAAKVTNSTTHSSVCLDSILATQDQINNTEITPKSELSLLQFTQSVKNRRAASIQLEKGRANEPVNPTREDEAKYIEAL
jgi:hypothetical protein